ncbi:hypothetical protein ACO7_660069 [Thiomonas arsenitoxydans]|nr:hypothetical protein ACO3_640071 [Thiomonas arsenitoxydans]CQR40867.1 hypothetical protein ACO7_660069 [Thiomonas arsenitoxydans]
MDQTLRAEAGTLATLSNANQQLACHHQFRAGGYMQSSCHLQHALLPRKTARKAACCVAL